MNRCVRFAGVSLAVVVASLCAQLRAHSHQ